MHHKRAPSQHISLGKPGSEVDFKIDTGADISVISENTFSSLKFKPKQAMWMQILRAQEESYIAKDSSQPQPL